MIGLWKRFVAAQARPVDTRPLAALRILLPLCVVFDLLRSVQLGMAEVYYRPWDAGGLSTFSGDAWVLGGLGSDVGPWLVVLVVSCMLLVSLGLGVRPALLVGVLAYAQLGHLYPPGDRGIDRIIRTTLLLLVFSRSHRRWALGDRLLGRPPVETQPAAVRNLVLWFLVLVYTAAGVSKLVQQPAWLSVTGTPVLYRVLTDPLGGGLDHLTWAGLRLPFVVGGWFTIAFEVGSLLLLTRWRPWFGVLGILMHVGIGVTMELGMFSAGMLCLYVVVMAEWWVPALDRGTAARPCTRPGG
ncbi:MAG: HTTM domain-containing protein [Myxococcota bacterium]|nr:HTTM domain-containing protein [Myxococcota bacterium]